MIAIGLERDGFLIATRQGTIQQRVNLAHSDKPVEVEFAGDDDHTLVTGWWTVGLWKSTGDPVWHRQIDVAQILPSRDFKWFAARFVPAHGPQYGNVALLDEGGRTVWRRDLWNASVAIAPDGAAVAFSGTPPSSQTEFPDSATDLWIADRSGAAIAHRRTVGDVQFMYDRGRCVAAGEQDASGGLSLVGYDRTLTPQWKLPRYRPGPGTHDSDSNLLIQRSNTAVRVYRLPTCGQSAAMETPTSQGRRAPGSWRRGRLGFLIGALAGFTVGETSVQSNRGLWFPFLAASWGGIGALIGAIDGVRQRERTLIYLVPWPPRP